MQSALEQCLVGGEEIFRASSCGFVDRAQLFQKGNPRKSPETSRNHDNVKLTLPRCLPLAQLVSPFVFELA
jgi:hypothetical protein